MNNEEYFRLSEELYKMNMVSLKIAVTQVEHIVDLLQNRNLPDNNGVLLDASSAFLFQAKEILKLK